MRGAGLIDALKKRYVKNIPPSQQNYEAVSLRSVLPVFGILTIGILLSVLIMLYENIISYFKCNGFHF